MNPLRAATFLLLLASPAAAEFCTFNGERKEIVVRQLKEPSCTMDNDLVFNAVTNENRYGPDEKLRTLLTGSWPGWGGADKKCAAARQSASKVVYSNETYILGKTILGGPQVWSFAGSCGTFKAKFEAKRRALEGDPSHQEVFEAVGAEKSDMGDLAERLVEGKKPTKD